jgi:hypothetical protein
MRRVLGEQRQDHQLEVLRRQPPRAREIIAAAPEKAMSATAEARPPAVPAHSKVSEVPKVEVSVVPVFTKHILRLLLKTYLTI